MYGYTEQPLPIIVGSYNAIEACYVNINDTFYKVENVLKAVDITFKIYHVLNVQYPPEAAIVWTFIERGIYEIMTNTTENYVSVSTLISDLQSVV